MGILMTNNTEHKLRSAKQLLADSVNKIIGEEIYLGFIGKGDSSKTVLVPGKPGYIFIRIPKTISNGELTEYSEHIAISKSEYRYNAPVEVVKSKKYPNVYEVRGIWIAGMGMAKQESTLASVGIHHWNHELYTNSGGHDPIMIDGAQIKNLQVSPTSPPSSRVIIGAGWYIWKDRTVHWHDSEEYELADLVPSGTLDNLYVSISMNGDTQEILTTQVLANILPGFQTDIKELITWPTEDYVPLACIRLETGNYQIGWSSGKVPSIINMRPQQSLMPGDMLPAIHPLNPYEGYHSGNLDSIYVEESDPSGNYSHTNLHDILESDIPELAAKVKVDQYDTTANYLAGKLKAGSNISINTINVGGDEQLEFDVSGTGGSSFYQTMQVDNSDQTQRGKLDLIAGSHITLTPSDDGVNDRTTVTIDADDSTVIDGANIGSSGTGVFSSLVSSVLQFFKLNSLSSILTIALDAINNKIDFDIDESAIDAGNVGGILGVAHGGSGADLSATGGTHQYLKQSTTGSAFSVGQPSKSDISDLETITTTPTASAIPKADGSGKLAAGWLQEVLGLTDLSDVALSGVTTDDILVRGAATWNNLAIAASRIIGKKASGAVAALTASDVWSIIAAALDTDIIATSDNTIKLGSASDVFAEIFSYLFSFKEGSAPSAVSNFLKTYVDTNHFLRFVNSLGQDSIIHYGSWSGYSSFTNDAGEHTIYSETIKGNSWGTLGGLHYLSKNTVENTATTARTVTYRIKLGSTTIVTFTSAGFASGASPVEFDIDFAIVNVGSTGTQRVGGTIWQNGGGTKLVGTATEDTTSDLVLSITAQLNIAVTTLTHHHLGTKRTGAYLA